MRFSQKERVTQYGSLNLPSLSFTVRKRVTWYMTKRIKNTQDLCSNIANKKREAIQKKHIILTNHKYYVSPRRANVVCKRLETRNEHYTAHRGDRLLVSKKPQTFYQLIVL